MRTNLDEFTNEEIENTKQVRREALARNQKRGRNRSWGIGHIEWDYRKYVFGTPRLQRSVGDRAVDLVEWVETATLDLPSQRDLCEVWL
jgi:hypothetical protein